MAMIHFSFHRPSSSDHDLHQVLNSAFGIHEYASNFPQIFSVNSSAIIAVARETTGRVVGLCAVDTEFWLEPSFLRGACIGSVAVDPLEQGRGIGRSLLEWVIEQLHVLCRHDFVYLFSERAQFYEALGFECAGTERLFALQPDLGAHPVNGDFLYYHPREVGTLDEAQLARLWRALECGRRSGESFSAWKKFHAVSGLAQLWVTWLEDAQHKIVAGAFVGKGADFKGVVHNFFASNHEFLIHFVIFFAVFNQELSRVVLFAPGQWTDVLRPILQNVQSQPLCMVRGLSCSTSEMRRLFEQGLIYPRSLFSS